MLRKRTSFAKNVTKKTAYKLAIDAYMVIARVVTNTFCVKSLINNAISVFPGDHPIKISNLDEEGLKQLVQSMETAAAKGLPKPSRPRTRARAAAEVGSITRFVVSRDHNESVISLNECLVW